MEGMWVCVGGGVPKSIFVPRAKKPSFVSKPNQQFSHFADNENCDISDDNAEPYIGNEENLQLFHSDIYESDFECV